MNHIYRDKKLLRKAQKIRVFLTDNDGVLTDGCVYYSAKGEELKKYNMRDGMGIERLRDLVKIETVIVTKESSGFTEARAKKLNIEHLYRGVTDKLEILTRVLNDFKVTEENVAFMGDDVNDLKILEKVGLSACPADAMLPVQKIVDYQSQYRGGHGAVRDFIEMIIFAQTELNS